MPFASSAIFYQGDKEFISENKTFLRLLILFRVVAIIVSEEKCMLLQKIPDINKRCIAFLSDLKLYKTDNTQIYLRLKAIFYWNVTLGENVYS